MIPRTLRLATRLLVVGGIAGALTAGCSLFKPDTPEKPTSAVSIHEDFTDPESTLATMQRAFAARADGATAYLHCLASPARDQRSFIFVFDPKVLAATQYSGAWTSNQEAIFYGLYATKFSTGDDSLGFAVVPADPDSEYTTGDTQVLVRSYGFVNIDRPSSAPQTMIHFGTGSARISFVRVGGRWVIQTWTDRVDPTVGVQPVDGVDYSLSYWRWQLAGNVGGNP